MILPEAPDRALASLTGVVSVVVRGFGRGYNRRMAQRSEAKLDQAVCSLEGLSTWLLSTPGELAVVIHADPDCVNVLPPGPGAAQLERFFCTNLDPDAAAAGRGPARLDECLDAVCASLQPPVVVLLGSCTAGLLGEDLSAVAERASRRNGVPVICPHGPAMQFTGQVEVADRFAALMIGLCEPGEADPDSVNLMGFDPGPELIDSLARAGVRVNAVLDLGAPFAAWQAIPAAAWTLVVDARMYADSLRACERRLGQRIREVPYPVGLTGSQAFVRAVIEAVRPDGPGAALDKRVLDKARQAVEGARARTRGLRLGYNLGSLKNFEPVSLARAGLLDLPAYEELGFEISLLLQGDDRRRRRDAARRELDGLGCAAPLSIFADTIAFGQLCRSLACELVVGADYLGPQLTGSGIGFLPHGSLRTGLDVVPANLERILAALDRARGV